MGVTLLSGLRVIILLEESDFPFECSEGMHMLNFVRYALSLFDDFSVIQALLRPVFREMQGV